MCVYDYRIMGVVCLGPQLQQQRKALARILFSEGMCACACCCVSVCACVFLMGAGGGRGLARDGDT